MTETDSAFDRFVERYESGQIPWDRELPPPEVLDIVARLAPGRGLDLGCGYGRTAVYLAQHGWEADGVDFVPQAIAGARRRAEALHVADKTTFYVGSVTALDFLNGRYDLAVDVGCMHVLTGPDLIAYRDGLLRLLKPGALYLLFVHVQNEAAETEDGRSHGILLSTVESLFATGFALEKVEHGVTKVEDKPTWNSAWFWYRRLAA